MKSAESRFRGRFEDGPVPSFIVAPGGLILEANRAARKLAAGRGLRDCLAPRFLPVFDGFLARVFSAAPRGPLSCEIEVQGGAAFHVAGSSAPGSREAQLAFIDITNSRNAERLARLGRWRWDLFSGAVDWSDGLYSIAGFDPAVYSPTFEGGPDLFTPESWARISAAVAETLRTLAPCSLDLQMRCAGGARKAVVALGSPVLDDTGAVAALQGALLDISERTLLEADLHKRQQISAKVERMGRIGGWERAVQSDVFSLSQGLSRILGVDDSELPRDALLDRVLPDDLPRVLAAMAETARDGAGSAEFRIRRKSDGAVRVVFSQARTIRDEAGNHVRTFGAMQDITERKELESALARRHQIWREAELIGAIGGWERDAVSNAVILSDGFAAILGTARREMSTGQLLEFIHPADLPKIEQSLREIADGSNNAAIEYRVRREDDQTERVLFAQARVVRDERGAHLRTFGVVRDVTERKQAEQALLHSMRQLSDAKARADDALRAKGLFLAAMSHEIRTPLNSVIGLAALFSTDGLTPQQCDFLQTIRSSGEMLLAIVNDILDFSKLEEGKLLLENIPFDLRAAAADAVRMLAEIAAGKGLSLTVRFPGSGPLPVRGDPGRLKQVLLNLLSNAVKFTDSGGSVTLSINRRPRGQFRFEVADTGIGIPEESQRSLFQLFSQADSSTTRRFGGTGLGLAISSRLVELLGGSIGVQSEAGRGSTFWFTAKLPAASAPPIPAETLAALRGRRALIVDANPGHAAQLAARLEALRIRPASASSASDAWAAVGLANAQGDPYLLFFIDPEIAGSQLAGHLRAAEPRSSRVALFTTSARRPSSLAGSDGFLLKPVSENSLLRALGRLTLAGRPAAWAAAARKGHVLVVEDNRVNQKVASASIERLGFEVDIAPDGLQPSKCTAAPLPALPARPTTSS